jgi:hypothetical protein
MGENNLLFVNVSLILVVLVVLIGRHVEELQLDNAAGARLCGLVKL